MGSTVALQHPCPQGQGAAGLGGGEHFWVASHTLLRHLRASKAPAHSDDLDSATLLACPLSLTLSHFVFYRPWNHLPNELCPDSSL